MPIRLFHDPLTLILTATGLAPAATWRVALHSPEEILELCADPAHPDRPVVIFTATSASALSLHTFLRSWEMPATLLTANSTAEERTEVLAFPAAQRVLVLTDAFNTGWRAPAGTLVVHAELPRDTADREALLRQREARAPHVF